MIPKLITGAADPMYFTDIRAGTAGLGNLTAVIMPAIFVIAE
jgi:hypothetical protein